MREPSIAPMKDPLLAEGATPSPTAKTEPLSSASASSPFTAAALSSTENTEQHAGNGWVFVFLLTVLAAFALLLVYKQFNHSSYADIATKRYQQAVANGSVHIAVVYAQGEEELPNGVDLAFPDKSVTVNGKKYNVVINSWESGAGEDEQNVQLNFARHIARDPSYVAVIGHSTSDIALSASVSYENTQLLFMANTATVPSLTAHGFGYTFRNVPTDEEYAAAIANLCEKLGVTRIGSFYEQAPHATGSTTILDAALSKKGITFSFERPYDARLDINAFGGHNLYEVSREANLRDQIASVQLLQPRPQMIALIGDRAPSAAAVWKALSLSGMQDIPVLLFGSLDSVVFLQWTGRQKNQNGMLKFQPILFTLDDPKVQLTPGGIYVVSLFSAAEQSDLSLEPGGSADLGAVRKDEVNQFVQNYIKRHPAPQDPPASLAMSGYAAAAIVKQALEMSSTAAPVDVRQQLISTRNKFTILGREFRFTVLGDVVVTRLEAPKSPLLFECYPPTPTTQLPVPHVSTSPAASTRPMLE